MLSTQELKIYSVHQEGFPEEAAEYRTSKILDAVAQWCRDFAVEADDVAFRACVAVVTHGAHKWRVAISEDQDKLTFEVLT